MKLLQFKTQLEHSANRSNTLVSPSFIDPACRAKLSRERELSPDNCNTSFLELADTATVQKTNTSTVFAATVAETRATAPCDSIKHKLRAHYENLRRIDRMLYAETADRLAMFRVFHSQMLEYGLLAADELDIDGSTTDGPTTARIAAHLSDYDVLRMLDTLQRIYVHLESILNHVLFIGKFELYRQIVSLIT